MSRRSLHLGLRREWRAIAASCALSLAASVGFSGSAALAQEQAAPAPARQLTPDEQALLADADAQNAQVGDLYGQGRYAEAIALAEESLAIRMQVLGDKHPDTAESLNNLGVMLDAMGDYAAALPYYERALAILREVHGEEHQDTAQLLNNLGYLQHMMGDYAAAGSYFERALAVRRKVLGNEHPDTAESLNNMGVLYQAMGEYVAAQLYLEQALAVCRLNFGEDHHATATSLDNLGMLLRSAGDFAAARVHHEQSLAIRRSILGEQHPDTANSLNNLGLLLQETGDYPAARPYYEQALAIYRAVYGEEHRSTAAALNNLGHLLALTGDFAAARPYYEQALAITRLTVGEEHPDTAALLNNLGVLLEKSGDYPAARHYLERALVMRRRMLGDDHPDTATSLNNMGGLLNAMGDFAAARPYHEQALAVRHKVVGDQHLDTAQSLNNLACSLQTTGDLAAARLHLEQALSIAVKLAEDAATAQNETGQLLMSRSVQFYLDNYVSLLMLTGDGDAEAYRAVLNWKGSTLVRQRAVRLAAANEELAPVVAELQAIVRQWSALLAAPRLADSQWQERFVTLAREKQRLELELSGRSAAFRAATAEVPIADVQRALPEDAVLVDYFEFWFNEPSPDAQGRRESPRSLAAFVVRPDGDVQMFDLGEAAPIDAAIDVWRASFGASVEAQAAGAFLLKTLWTPVAGVIGEARLVLASPDGALGKLPFAALPGKEPARFLIEDVALALVPVPRLIPELMQPQSVAAAIDRELLLVGGVDYDCRRESLAPPAPRMEDAYADAGNRRAARETAEGLQWDALQGTSGEVAAIGKLARSWGGWPEGMTAVLSGAAATEENFRAWAPRSRILHLATHGFFAPEERRSALVVTDPDAVRDDLSISRTVLPEGYDIGLLSGLVLAGANARIELPDDPAAFAALPEDGILTTEELAFLPLGNVELAVLSACETGLGEVAGGEGLLGIQRAFQISGVRTTVATLWKVDDVMTQRLMTAFYRNVLEGKQSYLDALRNAQIEMLKELRNPAKREALIADVLRGADAPVDAAAMERGAPYFWAAFTLSGDWR